jgi:hypothetical protein
METQRHGDEFAVPYRPSSMLFLYVVSGFSRTYLNPVTALVPEP